MAKLNFARSLILLSLMLLCLTKAESDHDHHALEEDEVLSEEILEEKQQAYLREGTSRDLQDDPTQYCTSEMEINVVTQIDTVHTQAMYPVSTGYPNNLRRCIIFRPSNDMFLEVIITFLSTETNFDFVEVYPIGSYDPSTRLVQDVGQRLLQLSGVILPAEEHKRKVVGRPGQTLMIVLRTDANRNIWTGFQASVESKYRDCYSGMDFIQTSRLPQVFSDGFVREYPPNYAYCWVIAPPHGEHVQVSFTAMNTEREEDTIELTTIQAFDMQRKTYTGKHFPPLGIFSGLTIPPSVHADVNELVLVSFRTDATLQFSGFSARASSPGVVPTHTPTKRPTHVDCESNVDLYIAPETSEGQTIDDKLGSYYLDSAFCYVITASSATTFVSVEFNELTLMNGDELEIFAVREPLSTNHLDRLPNQLALATRATSLPWFYAGREGQTLVLQLKTDRTQTSAHFRARIRSNAGATSTPTVPPTSPECTNGMVEVGPLTPEDDEITFDDHDEGFYPNNYHFCVVLLGAPGYRVAVTFDEVLIQDDRVEVFQARSYSLDTKRFTGRTLLRRFDAANLQKNVSLVVIARNEQPTIVSIRTNFGRNGRGYRARARLVAASEITSAPSLPSPSPTFMATKSPTALFRCNNRMAVVHVRETSLTFTDDLRVVPRGSVYCWVLVPSSFHAFTQVDFSTVGLGTGATLQIGPIREYNHQRRTYDGFSRQVDITSKGTRYEGRPGALLLIKLTTDRLGARTGGFTATTVAPCFCPMFESAERCRAAKCQCVWEPLNFYCNFARN